jgi:hypothetical protein
MCNFCSGNLIWKMKDHSMATVPDFDLSFIVTVVTIDHGDHSNHQYEMLYEDRDTDLHLNHV